jgi:hypothetical protein
MIDRKHPLQSIGVMGPAIGLVVFAANQFKPGLGLTTADVGGFIDHLDLVISSIIAIYGRWSATKEVSISAPILTPAKP